MSGVPASETRATASLAHPLDQAGPHPVGIMIVIGNHRPLDADMAEQLGRDPAVLDRDQVGPARIVGGARRQIGEIADRGRDDIEAGGSAFMRIRVMAELSPGRKRGGSSASKAAG
jgi:hypothetical protein